MKKYMYLVLFAFVILLIKSIPVIQSGTIEASTYKESIQTPTSQLLNDDYTAKVLPSFLEKSMKETAQSSKVTINANPTLPFTLPNSFKDLALTNDITLNNLSLTEEQKAYLMGTLNKPTDNTEVKPNSKKPIIMVSTLSEFKSY